MPGTCTCIDDLPKDVDKRQRFLQYARETNMHGPESIVRSQNIVRRIGWTVMFLAGCFMTLWLSITLINDYYTNPTKTVISLTHNTSMRFPAVTICNINPIRVSGLKYAGEGIRRLLMNRAIQMGGRSMEDIARDSGVSIRNLERNTYLTFKLMYSNLSKEVLQLVGHNISSMVLKCDYNAYECSSKNFTQFHNPMYGNCYMFNSGLEEQIVRTDKTGPLAGLSLELYIEHEEYIAILANDAGIRVTIHDQSQMPFPEDFGFSLSPGLRTYVGISMTETRRAVFPYGDCKEYSDQDNIALNAFADTSTLRINYSDSACARTCFQRYLINSCGCCAFEYPCTSVALNDAWGKHSIRGKYCNRTRKVEDQCIKNAERQYEDGRSPCLTECKQSCKQSTFSSEVSMSMWPSNPHMIKILAKLKKKDKKLNDLNEEQLSEFLRTNVMKLDVYYKQLDFKTIETSPSYGVDNLLSDIGGQLGLWVGLSIVTLFEFVELVADLIILLVRKCRGKWRRNAAYPDVDRSITLVEDIQVKNQCVDISA